MVSENVSEREAWGSPTATRMGIDNTPTTEHLANIKLLLENVFEPLRRWVGSPIKINSLYRSSALNLAVGGASKSDHMDGCAIDIDDDFKGATNAQMFEYIKNNLDFDKLIWEFGDDTNPDWVHISYRNVGNRKQVMKASKNGGRTVYKKI